MFGPYTNLTALNEAVSGEFHQYQVGDLFSDSSWKLYDSIEVDKKFKNEDALTFRYNLPLELLYKAVFVNPKYKLDTYVQVFPAAELPASVRAGFKHALNKEALLRNVAHVTKHGYLPNFIRVYLVGGFTTEEIEELVGVAWQAYEGLQANKGSQEYWLNIIRQYADILWSRKKKVIAWSQWRFHVIRIPGNTTAVKFEFTEDGDGIPLTVGIGGHRFVLSSEEEKFVSQVQTKDKIGKISQVINKIYGKYAWNLFKQFVKEEVLSPLSTELNDAHVVGQHYNAAKGIPLDVTAKPVNQAQQRKGEPEREGEPTRDLQHPTGEPGRGSRHLQVVPSIRSTDFRFDVVTADPGYRAWIQADGTVQKPAKESVDQRDTGFMPVDSVRPLIENTAYKVIFGIFFDNPLIKKDLNSNTYWYATKDHLLFAVRRYATFTGDRPILAYIIYNKLGNRAGLPITAKQLAATGGVLAQKIKTEIDNLVRSFWREADEGQRNFPVAISQWLGVPAAKFYVPDNPYRDVPEDIDPAAWNKYVRIVRRALTRDLGLNFKASLNATELEKSTKLAFHRHQIDPRIAKNRTQKFSGARDEKGKVVEEWGVYLIEYLLAYGQSSSGVAPSYMIPITVERSTKGNIPPHQTLTKVDEQFLRDLLKEHWPSLTFAPSKKHGRVEDEWVFLKGNPRDSFPYARLIRPVVIENKEHLQGYNARLPKHLQRVHHGLVVDGIEYEAYVMITTMPPSVAEKEWNLLYRGGTSRRLIADPDILTRLITSRGQKGKSLRGLGLTPRPLRSSFPVGVDPVAKASQTEPDPYTRLGWVPGMATKLEPSFFLSDIGDRWKPLVKTTLDEAGRVVTATIEGYEHLNSLEQREAHLARWYDQLRLLEQKTEHQLTSYLISIIHAAKSLDQTSSSDATRRVQPYMDYVKRDTPAGGKMIVPELTHKVALNKYSAVVQQYKFRPVLMSIKAPSEDIAKLTILYRLLRRSWRNKEVGKAMLHKSLFTGKPLLPDIFAHQLAYWAANNYVVLLDQEPHARFVHRQKFAADDPQISRTQRAGEHRYARMLGFES